MAEQRYQAVLALISAGLSISQIVEKIGVSRQKLHSWLARYEAEGLDGLVDRSHRRDAHGAAAAASGVPQASRDQVRRPRPGAPFHERFDECVRSHACSMHVGRGAGKDCRERRQNRAPEVRGGVDDAEGLSRLVPVSTLAASAAECFRTQSSDHPAHRVGGRHRSHQQQDNERQEPVRLAVGNVPPDDRE